MPFYHKIEENTVDPDQTAPTEAVWSGESTVFVYEA